MNLSEESRKKLRSANVVSRGYILAAKCATTSEEVSEALCKALLPYGVWWANELHLRGQVKGAIHD